MRGRCAEEFLVTRNADDSSLGHPREIRQYLHQGRRKRINPHTAIKTPVERM
jgi:hypothetical protein